MGKAQREYKANRACLGNLLSGQEGCEILFTRGKEALASSIKVVELSETTKAEYKMIVDMMAEKGLSSHRKVLVKARHGLEKKASQPVS